MLYLQAAAAFPHSAVCFPIIALSSGLDVIMYFLFFIAGGASFSFCSALYTALLDFRVTCSDSPELFSVFVGFKNLRILVLVIN